MLEILLTGACGFVGGEILDLLGADADLRVTTAGRTVPPNRARHVNLDLTQTPEIARVFETVRPDVVIHAAAMADVAACEREPELARRCNTTATSVIASCAANLGTTLVFISTDQVFDGSGSWYAEDAPIRPVNVYGATKAEAEEAVRRELSEATILRLALVIGRSRGRASGSDQVIGGLRRGQAPTLFTDEFRTPIHVLDAARMIVETALARDRPRLMHLGGPDRVSRYDLGCSLARGVGLDPGLIRGATHAEVRPWPCRPADVSLDTSLLRSWTASPPRGLAEACEAC